MSTLNVNTVQSSTSNPPIFKNSGGDVAGTLARAWVNFNGTGTVAIRDSYNVSSITDNGTGNYTVNFGSAMSSINYSTVISGDHHYSALYGFAGYVSSTTTSSVGVLSVNVDGTFYDNALMCVTVFAN